MLAVIPFLLFASGLVRAAPFERRASHITLNCNHDFAYTWDDGPYKSHDKINEIFSGADSHTTFFINGNNWSCIYDEGNVAALRASYEAGHQLAHHTWSHADLKSLTYAKIDAEIGRLNDAFIRILGAKPKFFRPPYGSITEAIAEYIETKFNIHIVMWSDDSHDAGVNQTEKWNYDYYTGLAALGNSSPRMSLSHETVEGSIEALENGTVTNLKAANINLVTTATCLDLDPYETVTGHYGARDASWTCDGPWVPGDFSHPPSSSTSTSTSSTTSTPSSTSSSQTPTVSPTCRSWWSPSSPTTCEAVAAHHSVQAAEIKSANSFVNCADIWAGTWLCIPTSSATSTTSATPPAPTCASTYTSAAGDNCISIETKFGLSSGVIEQANSFVNCNDIWQGTPICIPPAGACAKTISAPAGATCDDIGAQNGVSGTQIKAWNDFLNCQDIWQGTPICIPPAGACTKTISAPAGVTCDDIGAQNGVSGTQIKAWNDFLNCQDIWQYTPVCVSHS